MNAYVCLAIAIAAEIIGTTALKYSDGMTRLGPAVVVAGGYGLAFWMLSLALKSLPIGFAYAVWAGIGVAAIKAVGVVLFKEPLTVPAVLGTALVIAGVAVLHLSGGSEGGR